MAHTTLRSGYRGLVDRLNRFPQGCPPSETLYQILSLLFTEKEARLVSLLPIKEFTAAQAARNWKVPETEARSILDALADRALLLDTEDPSGRRTYFLPPPMAGFIEFSLMRIRTDVDQKLLAELYYQYLNVEEDFIKALFANGETQLGRVFVQEAVLSADNALHVLEYERATEVARTATAIGVGVCYCRHKMQHVGRDCGAPKDICMTFNGTAASLVKHGFARQVDASECMDLLQQAQALGLVQFGENVQRSVSFICNCCGCCCEAMIAARKFGVLNPVHTTRFMPVVAEGSCSGCGACVKACPVEAIGLVSANDPRAASRKKARVNGTICLGCGVCVRACAGKALSLAERGQRVITPVNSVHRAVIMAIERGKLQDLIFDNHAMASHRAMAAILGVILKLPPLKQAMASRQMKSRYLARLLG